MFPNLENVDTAYKFEIHVDSGENLNWMVSNLNKYVKNKKFNEKIFLL